MPWDEAGKAQATNRVGFRKPNDAGNDEFYVLKEAFRSDLCDGYDYRQVSAELLRRGLLLPGSDGGAMSSHRLPGMPVTRCYRISAAILGDTDPIG